MLFSLKKFPNPSNFFLDYFFVFNIYNRIECSASDFARFLSFFELVTDNRLVDILTNKKGGGK